MARRVAFEKLIGVVMFACCAASADLPLRFGAAPADSNWEFTGDRLACRMEQVIPDFGPARFVQEAGGPLVFDATSWRVQLRGEASVHTQSPPWIVGDFDDEDLGGGAVPTSRRFVASHDVAEGMLRALYRGQYSNVTVGDVSVAVSAVGFRPVYDAYAQCVSALLPASFSQLERSTISFGSGKDDLAPAAKARLDRIAEYVGADASVARIMVDGYSDGAGLERKNRELSERRAYVVAEYLIEAGCSRERIETRYHGSRFPIAPNDTEEGRAQNRRVTVHLERGAAPRVAQR